MPLSKCCSAPMKVVGDVTKYYLCECCKKATDAEEPPHIHKWIRSYSGGSDKHGTIVCMDIECGEMVLNEEAFFKQEERAKWLTEVRRIQAQMPVAGNGRRLIMQLISKMEE